jgi:autotransporter-associated beta strand protein
MLFAPFRLARRCASFVTLSWLSAQLLAPLQAVPAFPGAEGFGANAIGGRGGTVYHVTNLNDNGAGSFRDAVSVAGRTVVFDVGGIIVIGSPVVVKANITIAGQTAPGEGVMLYGDRISFSDANNTVVRYMRFREGINGDSGTDAVGAASGNLMMFDHISASWGRDETFSLSGTPSNVTIQDSIIGQGLLIHSAGSLIQTSGGVSIFRCLYIDNYMRNPKVKGVNDYQNNVVYNWGSGGGYIPAGDSAGLSYANLINNYFITGPTFVGSPFKSGNLNYNIYHAGNFQDLNNNGALDGTLVTDASFPTLQIVPTQFNYAPPATLLTAQQSVAHVLAYAGASLRRDAADSYMIAELASLGLSGAQISNESEMGGVGTLAAGLALKDTDNDGVPDAWEEAAGTNPLVADNNGDINGDGYTNLENYLNALAVAGVPAATIVGITNDTGSSAADGVTSDNTLVLRGTAAAGAVVTVSRLDLGPIGTAVADGAGQWVFDYSGTALADRYYAFTATVALGGGKVSPPTRAFLVKVDTTAAAAPAITSIVTMPSFVFSGTAEPGSTVTVTRVGAGAVGTTTTDGIGNWSAAYSGPSLPPGSYSFTASAVDLAGNPGAASPPYVVNTSLAAPIFTGITTDAGSSATDFVTNDSTLTFNGTSFGNATVTLTRLGVGVIGTATATSAGAWSFVYPVTLTAGTHTFTATASSGGNASPASAPCVVTLDLTRPTVSSIRRQTPPTSATTASTVVFRVTYAEAVTGVDLSDFTLTLSGVTGTVATLSPVSSTTYDVTVTGVGGDGTVRLDGKNAGVSDIAGNALNTAYTAGQAYTIRLPGSGVWISTDSGDVWSDSANWENGTIANGAGATVDFGSRNFDGDVLVQLDAPRTLGRVVFGDTDFTTPALWTLGNNGVSGNILTLAGTTPNLQVDAATTPTGDTADVPAANAYPATLDLTLAGSSGFRKTGVGTLLIARPATISGPLTITKGIVEVGAGGAFSPSSVTISTSQQLRVSGGAFSTAGDVTWTSGTGTGIIVSGGTASFQRILPSNVRNSFVRVTGGTMTATEITFPRSGDSESQAIAAGILISGGDTTVGTVGLGTADSWGAMTVSNGRMTVTGPLSVGYQKTSTRGGVVVVSGGELNVLDASATGGMILARNPGGSNANTNNVARFTMTGGVSNIARLTLGYDASSSAGSATVSLTNAELNLGAGGLVKNGGSGLASSVTLNSGTLGAFAGWSTTHSINLAGTPATLALRGASATGAAFDFTLAGPLTGTGGFSKSGAGTVRLTAANTFTGDVVVTAGPLVVDGGVASGGAFAIAAGGTLRGTGTINRQLTLQPGGTIAPGGTTLGTLTAGALIWNASGRLAVNLGATGTSDRLALTGALMKGTSGSFEIAFTPGSGFAPGNTYTIATFGSTDFAASDFTATGLPGNYAAAFNVTSTSLQVVLVATPVITSPTSATGTYGQPFTYAITASNAPTSFTAIPLPPGLSLNPATGVISGTAGAAGNFTVNLGASNLAGTGTASLTISVAKAVAVASIGTSTNHTAQTAYTGNTQSAPLVTAPAGLNATFTYNGSTTAPTLPGTYLVVATIDDSNYTGTATGTLIITITALVREASEIHGQIDGSMQLVTAAPFALSGQSFVSGDILVPGMPEIQVQGAATLAGVKDAAGAASPGDYDVALTGNSLARYVVRRVDAIPLPVAAVAQPPTGSRDVALHNENQNPGNFSTIRNLTLGGNVGPVVLPAGAYGELTAGGNSSFILGVAGGTEPAVYYVQSLVLNGNASVVIAGPVRLILAQDVTFSRSVEVAANSGSLTVELATGSFGLTAGAELEADIIAPAGEVSLSGGATLWGHVSARRLTIAGDAALVDPSAGQ